MSTRPTTMILYLVHVPVEAIHSQKFYVTNIRTDFLLISNCMTQRFRQLGEPTYTQWIIILFCFAFPRLGLPCWCSASLTRWLTFQCRVVWSVVRLAKYRYWPRIIKKRTTCYFPATNIRTDLYYLLIIAWPALRRQLGFPRLLTPCSATASDQTRFRL